MRDPSPDAHLTHLRKVGQVLTTVEETDTHQVGDAMTGQLITASATSIIQSLCCAEPDRATPAMGRKLTAA